jgi:hypothetical protein
MQSLIDAPVEELDPETQAICDEVCGALSAASEVDPWAEPEYRHLRFGRRWWIALRSTGDHDCRQRIIAACDQIVRADAELWMGQGGVIYPREQIGQYDGRTVYLTDEQTGELRQVLQWPTGTYANGEPSYERKDAA